jgi:hypothetical protein
MCASLPLRLKQYRLQQHALGLVHAPLLVVQSALQALHRQESLPRQHNVRVPPRHGDQASILLIAA